MIYLLQTSYICITTSLIKYIYKLPSGYCSGGFSFMRVAFLIDGFNLYHSIEEAEKDTGSACKWLNLHSLMSKYLQHIDKTAVLEKILFFTAVRRHVEKTNPNTVKRHKQYLHLLRSVGVEIIEGKFKSGKSYCRVCRNQSTKFEEKETDVNIAVKLVELALLNAADTFVLVSGDTDLIPGVDAVLRNFPQKSVYVIFPYKRKNTDILKRVKGNFKINKDTYSQHQFPDPHTVGNRTFNKPAHW